MKGIIVFFFFQAEDGIRDLTVTGVQTCALPIYGLSARQPRLPASAGRVRTGAELGARGRPDGARARALGAAPDQRRHRAFDIRVSEPGDSRDAARVPGEGGGGRVCPWLGPVGSRFR